MFCPKCGKKIEGEPKICPGCGEDIFYIWQQSGIKELWDREDAMFSFNRVRQNMFIFSGLMVLGFVLAVLGIIICDITLMRLLFTGIVIILAASLLFILGYFRMRLIHLNKKLHS
ncbi:MAG: zinc ribbon domain-containing protein [Thermoplasmatales archaeon]|nr:zinc ribbon domain-containing protein [Thermoplasmatales archaeon]